MEIKLTNEESETYFHNALCNGLSYMCSSYDLSLLYSETEYSRARKNLQKSNQLNATCFEDVLLQLLRDGGKLTLLDEEDEENVNSITLADVHERVSKTPIRHLMNMVNENDDAETADVIIQTVFLGEVIYG